MLKNKVGVVAMHDIDSGNGYVYGEDPAVEQMKDERLLQVDGITPEAQG